jgi:predicted membrane channel-forming protein YqfA (hemolysin III family)
LFYNNDLSFVTSQVWDGALAETSHITSIGLVIYTSYPIWLILTSLILLLAMVGAIVITIKQSRISKKFITFSFVFFLLAVSIKAPLIFFLFSACGIKYMSPLVAGVCGCLRFIIVKCFKGEADYRLIDLWTILFF